MKERRDAHIEEVDGGGYVVRLDWDWREDRPKEATKPVDRKLVFTDLNSAVEAVTAFLTMPIETALIKAQD